MSDIVRNVDCLYPPFKDLMITLQKKLADAKIPAFIFESLRSFDRCKELYSQGRKFSNGKWIVTNPKAIVTNSTPGKSFHNYGLACDYVCDGDLLKPGIQWSWDKSMPWDKFGAVVKTIPGLRWGGNFKSIVDVPHVEYDTAIPISTMLNTYNVSGLSAVWKLLDEERMKKK